MQLTLAVHMRFSSQGRRSRGRGGGGGGLSPPRFTTGYDKFNHVSLRARVLQDCCRVIDLFIGVLFGCV